MNAKIYYLPGAQEQYLANKIVQLGILIKKDVARYLKYSERELTQQVDNDDSKKISLLMTRCKVRMLDRLEKVARMQSEFQKSDEDWQEILRKSLEKVDRNSPDFQRKLEILFASFHNDRTKSKVHFMQIYMMLIADISPDSTSIPFTP